MKEFETKKAEQGSSEFPYHILVMFIFELGKFLGGPTKEQWLIAAAEAGKSMRNVRR